MKLSNLFEDQDYGSRFIDQRDLIRKLESKLEALEAELSGASAPADLRDFESDKDRGGGVPFIRRAIAKIQRRLGSERFKLEELKELWDTTRSKLGE